jgi:ERCC4-type nuclease
MNADIPLIVSATRPRGKPAALLAGMGLAVLPIEEDEGNVDRYVLSKRLAVERRTGAAFLRGIMDKTLFTSAIYLREHFDVPVLIVEGEVDYSYGAFDPRAVRGALSAMMLEYGVSVLSTADVEETAALLAMMARQEQAGIPEISLIPKRKVVDLPDMQRRIVEMLPGAGMVIARDLLRRFGSVRRVVNATEDELRAVRGIGAKKAREIVKVLGAEYEAVDTERDLEDAVEAEPRLLFGRPVELLARQHYIFADERERHFVDLVVRDPKAGEVVLVELKRGRLSRGHVEQLQRYLEHARDSALLRAHLERGAALRGLLATVEPCELDTKDPRIGVHIVDRRRAIRALKRLRQQRMGRAGG